MCVHALGTQVDSVYCLETKRNHAVLRHWAVNCAKPWFSWNASYVAVLSNGLLFFSSSNGKQHHLRAFTAILTKNIKTNERNCVSARVPKETN